MLEKEANNMINSFNDFLVEMSKDSDFQQMFGELVDFYSEKNSKIIQGIVLLQGMLDETVKIEDENPLGSDGMMNSREIILDMRRKNDIYEKMERAAERLSELLKEYNKEVGEALDFFDNIK